MTEKPLILMLITISLCLQVVMQTSEAQTTKSTVQAAEADDVDAKFEVGKSKLRQKGQQNKREALELFEKAANEGHSGAAFHAAVMYERGFGTSKNINSAIQYYLKAAEGGDADAMFTLSKLYDSGRGNLKKDQKKARQWYDKFEKEVSNREYGATSGSILRHSE